MKGATPDPAAPLAGLRVLDLTRVLAGPACGRLLADLGADVVKLEPPEEDLSRFVAPKEDRGMSGLYTLANAGKRNLCVDLRAPGASEVVLALARTADAVLENFRPGVLERLGLGWAALHAATPRTVLLSINGYGSASAWRERAAYAPAVHAQAGALSYQSEWTGLPLAHLADNLADMSGALHGTIALLAALLRARETGVGQHVEVPLFDALLSFHSETPFALLPEPKHRDETPLFDASPCGVFVIAGSMQNCWHRMKRTHGLTDPARPDDDVATKRRLRTQAIEAWMRAQGSAEAIFAGVEEAGLGGARVETLRDALTGPLARERGLLVELDDRRGGRRPVVRAPYWFSGETCPIRRPAPRRGEHNAEVLREWLGLDEARIRGLAEDGVLRAAEEETGS